jgi:hypothetical protein
MSYQNKRVNINRGTQPDRVMKVGEETLPSIQLRNDPDPDAPVVLLRNVVETVPGHAIEYLKLDRKIGDTDEVFDVITLDQSGNIIAAAEFLSLAEAREYLYETGLRPFDTIEHGRVVRQPRLCLGAKARR